MQLQSGRSSLKETDGGLWTDAERRLSSDCRGGKLGGLGHIVGCCSGSWVEGYQGFEDAQQSDESPWEGKPTLLVV